MLYLQKPMKRVFLILLFSLCGTALVVALSVARSPLLSRFGLSLKRGPFPEKFEKQYSCEEVI